MGLLITRKHSSSMIKIMIKEKNNIMNNKSIKITIINNKIMTMKDNKNTNKMIISLNSSNNLNNNNSNTRNKKIIRTSSNKMTINNNNYMMKTNIKNNNLSNSKNNIKMRV